MQPIYKAERDPAPGPVHLQHPECLFQHPKPHAFLPSTPPNVDPSPCVWVAHDNPNMRSLHSSSRSCSFQSTVQFCTPSLSHSLLRPTSSAQFHPVPTDDAHARSPAHRHLRWTPHHTAILLAVSFPLQRIPLRQSLRETVKLSIWHLVEKDYIKVLFNGVVGGNLTFFLLFFFFLMLGRIIFLIWGCGGRNYILLENKHK